MQLKVKCGRGTERRMKICCLRTHADDLKSNFPHAKLPKLVEPDHKHMKTVTKWKNYSSTRRKTLHVSRLIYLFIFVLSLCTVCNCSHRGPTFHRQLSQVLNSKSDEDGLSRLVRSAGARFNRSPRRIRRDDEENYSDYVPSLGPAESHNMPDMSYGASLYPDGFSSECDMADLKYDNSSDGGMHEFVAKLYNGPVCALVDVRNTPDGLKDLENCTIVNGFVQIVFMHNTKESDFEKYTFPKLRVITEYLLIYRVYGLHSLKKMFPNLSVIHGRRVFLNYGLVIYENPQLQDLGLGSLQQISRGGVRIQKNNKLCYLHTVDWSRLGMVGDEVINKEMSRPVIKDNTSPEDETCLNQCENNCKSSAVGDNPHCWSLKQCQKPTCPPQCPNACRNGRCECHEECLAGCSIANNASACYSCINKYHDGVCVSECPVGTYLKDEWRCVSKELCKDLNWVLHDDKCVSQCPAKYAEKRHDDCHFYCVYCGINCRMECDLLPEPEYVVNDIKTLQRLHGCTTIRGRLVITAGGVDFLEQLEKFFSSLEEVSALVIRRMEALVSLSFLRNLRRITGEKETLMDETYSLYVLNNQNLRELFTSTNSSDIATSNSGKKTLEQAASQLSIGGGKVFFHFNPRLCSKEIEKVSSLTAEIEDDQDISAITNGDRATCDMMPLYIESIEHKPMQDSDLATVRITWQNVNISDPRTLIGYQVIYKETKFTNVTQFEGVYACGKSSTWFIKDKLVNPNEAASENASKTSDAVLHDLKPFTQYAVYVRTYTTSTAKRGAQSNITYFTTKPAHPSEPMDLKAIAVNTTSIYVDWEEPISPNGNLTHYIIRWRRQREDMELVRSVNLCHGEDRYPVGGTRAEETPDPFDLTQIMEPKESSTSSPSGKKCCSCDSGKEIFPQHEKEASNDLNFENFLHKNLLQIRYHPFQDYGMSGTSGKRRRRSLEESVADRYKRAAESGSEEYFTDEMPINSTSEWVTVGYDDSTSYDSELPLRTIPTIGDDYGWHSAMVRGTNTTLKNLQHFAEYEIQVYSCNHASFQPDENSVGAFHPLGCSIASLASTRTRGRPDVDVIPRDSFRSIEVSVRSKSGEIFTQPALQWIEPIDPNGYIKVFTIEIQRKQDEDYSEPETNCYSLGAFEKNNGTYLIRDSEAPGQYRVRVMPVSLAAKGDWTEYVTFTVPDRSPAKEREQYLWVVAIVSGALLVTLSLVFAWYYYRRRRAESKNAMIYSSANPEYVSLAANYIPDGYEVDEDDVEILREIGHGNFGKVFVGYAKKVIKGEVKTLVAIKKLHEKSGIHKRIEFLEEAKLMKAFNSTHVVRLLGVVSQTVDPLVIMEYMEKGDLKSFLRDRREDSNIDNRERFPPPNLQEKLQMAAEIADGMAYLSAIKYVHRDLAARNCLVNSAGTVKIGDFGLTRDIYETDYYRKGSRGLLPIRWMAPESLKDGFFDSRSDVWSYGVVLWEVATLAEQPYQGLPHDQVTRYVIDGGYMERPKGCPKKLYDLMLICWQFSAQYRPTFIEILTQLSGDVNDRFREESHYFEQKRLHPENFHVDDSSSRKGFGTPINITPARSRSGTPYGCHTPASRYSNGSSRIVNGIDCPVKDCEHQTTTGDTPILPNGYIHSVSADNNIPKRASSLLRKLENAALKGSRDDSPRMKKASPKCLSRHGDFYYSLSSSGLGADLNDDSSVENEFSVDKNRSYSPKSWMREHDVVDGVGDVDCMPVKTKPVAGDNRSCYPHNWNRDSDVEDVDADKLNQIDENAGQNGISYATLSITPNVEKVDVNTPPTKIKHVADKQSNDSDKPYAHMNGFIKRKNSGNNRCPTTSPCRKHSRKSPCPDEWTYVETNPQVNSNYFESNQFHPLRAPPSPPTTPPPFPPPTRPLVPL